MLAGGAALENTISLALPAPEAEVEGWCQCLQVSAGPSQTPSLLSDPGQQGPGPLDQVETDLCEGP